VTRRSARGVDDAVRRLLGILDAEDLTVFTIVDHSGEAEAVGLGMPNVKLVVFGNPAADTAVMLSAPLIALDLPLKLLVWEDVAGATWLSYNAASFLSSRHGLGRELEPQLGVVEGIVSRLLGDDE
jgi:uncharacterized protein (DUF302 family)